MQPDTKIEQAFRLQSSQKKALEKQGIKTVADLLYYFPSRYNHIADIKNISDLTAGDKSVVYGKVLKTKTSKAYRKKIPIGEADIEDATGKLHATWFNQPYAAKMLEKGAMVKLAGTIQKDKNGKLYMANPEFEKISGLPIDVGDSLWSDGGQSVFAYPVYPERRGITSRWLYHATQKLLKAAVLENISDPIPEEVRERYNLPTLKSALIFIHAPRNDRDVRAARKRFAFEEIFFIQLARQRARKEYKLHDSFQIEASKESIKEFLARFSFPPTGAQNRAIDAIMGDFAGTEPMTRLLEGDVGSGKTLVAATTAYTAVVTRPQNPSFAQGSGRARQDFGNLQVAYMAPTEILAEQHFQSFVEYFSHLPINIALITGSGCKKFPSKVDAEKPTNISRAQLLKWVKGGEIAIIIGTHALIQKSVEFKDLAYVIVDEQHRFGTHQRALLVRKDNPSFAKAPAFAEASVGRSAGKRVPHLLSMTATPIPRTLALTIYGDLDLTLLDEMPPNRKQVNTEVVLPSKREETYEVVRKELKAGRQVYVICPRIAEPDPEKARALRVKSVKEEAARLKERVFPEYTIGVLHGKLTPKEKEVEMKKFAEGETDILVATSVVEVGVNVPNATTIIIEGAERFGLAQLHQLRGRVLRSEHQAYCYLFSDTKTKSSLERLKALTQAKNGFELAELDLQLRGAGELAGNKQWGVSDLGMEAIKNIKMVEAARTEAQGLLKNDPELKNYPLVQSRLAQSGSEVHFE